MTTGAKAAARLDAYRRAPRCSPLFFVGDALDVLSRFPSDTFDCCMTSPPYWGKRDYGDGGIGLEKSHHEFVHNVCAVFAEVKRVPRCPCSQARPATF